MLLSRSKILAIVIALIYLGTAIVLDGWDGKGFVVMCILLLLPLAFIWFPDEIADYSSSNPRFGIGRGFNSATPASMVTLVGWLGLLGYFPLLVFLLTRSAN